MAGVTSVSSVSSSQRLGPGSYVLKLSEPGGRTVLVLNAFHPAQLYSSSPAPFLPVTAYLSRLPYYSPSNVVILFEALSTRSWRSLRQDFIGATDPAKALAGSLRNRLLVDKAKFGLAEVASGSNAFHLSAGPLEGMVELQRFFGVGIEETSFGRGLLRAAFPLPRIALLSNNPLLPGADGKLASAFDLTEELDQDIALTLLTAAKL